jgi:hypothetical protein
LAVTTLARFRFIVSFAIDFPPNYGRQGSISQARLASETTPEYKKL